MDDMMDLTAGDAMVWRRLEAYAETRLSPDLATTSRLRARVLAVAHRQAALARADAGLSVLPAIDSTAAPAPFSPQAQRLARTSAAARARSGRRWTWRRAAGIALAASLGVGAMAGSAFAARPGGPLYEARVFAETLLLPADPSARAVAELDRLKDRLHEIGEAARAGDAAGAMAALAAYEEIVDQASASAILTGDDVAAAALETGVGHNLEVLQALMSRVPEQARPAISAAVDRAIARSTGAVERIHSSRSAGSPPVYDGAGAPATDPTPTPKPTNSPAAKPTATSTSDATATPRPTRKPTPEPTATPEPATPEPATPEPAVTTEPTAPPAHTPRPHPSKSPPGQGEHGLQGAQGGG